MDSQTSKIELVKMILNIENEKFIEKIKDFIQKENVDFWDELSLSEQKEIEKGIEELDKGKRIELIRIYNDQFTKDSEYLIKMIDFSIVDKTLIGKAERFKKLN